MALVRREVSWPGKLGAVPDEVISLVKAHARTASAGSGRQADHPAAAGRAPRRRRRPAGRGRRRPGVGARRAQAGGPIPRGRGRGDAARRPPSCWMRCSSAWPPPGRFGATTGPRSSGRSGLGPAPLPTSWCPTSTATTTVADVIRASIAAALIRMVRHDPGIRLGDDPEHVHQARVGTRRLRSDLRTFRSLLDQEWAARVAPRARLGRRCAGRRPRHRRVDGTAPSPDRGAARRRRPAGGGPAPPVGPAAGSGEGPAAGGARQRPLRGVARRTGAPLGRSAPRSPAGTAADDAGPADDGRTGPAVAPVRRSVPSLPVGRSVCCRAGLSGPSLGRHAGGPAGRSPRRRGTGPSPALATVTVGDGNGVGRSPSVSVRGGTGLGTGRGQGGGRRAAGRSRGGRRRPEAGRSGQRRHLARRWRRRPAGPVHRPATGRRRAARVGQGPLASPAPGRRRPGRRSSRRGPAPGPDPSQAAPLRGRGSRTA